MINRYRSMAVLALAISVALAVQTVNTLVIAGESKSGSSSAEVDLNGAFEHALSYWTEIKVREINVNEAQEKKEQAKGGLYPKATFVVSHLRQDDRDSAKTDYTFGEGITKAGFNFQQPVFRGFAEYAALRATEGLYQASRWDLAQQKIVLYQNVMASYYDVLMAEKDWENLRHFFELAQDRISDLKKRVSIGKSRKAELLAAKSLAATIEAQVVEAKGRVLSKREQLVFWTGIESSAKLSFPTKELETFTSLPKVESYLEDLKGRPDMAAQEERVKASEEGINVAKGGHYPTVDLVGNVYLKRENSMKGSNWDLGLFVSVPVFEGGITDSRIKESAFEKNKAILGKKQIQEKSESDVKVLYETTLHLLEQIKSLRQSEKLAHENYEQQKNEYQLGLTTELEVLTAFNSYLDSKRQLDRVQLLARSQYYTLESMVGRVPGAALVSSLAGIHGGKDGVE